ncbi:MAG: type II secretion system F family protein [Candidatus Aminicenantes bacterium]|jgi:type IV pilus assembly protein PilC
MPYFNCVFVNDEGKYSTRMIFAENKNELWRLYSDSDEKLLKIKRFYLKKDITLPKFIAGKIKAFDFLLFNQKMITLLKSGLTFSKGLEIILKSASRGTLKEVLTRANTDINNGIQISDAFSSNQIPFQKIYSASLLAGERSGSLETILAQFNNYLEKIANMRRRVFSSLAYPVVLFTVMIAMVFIILVYAIPKFSDFYQDFDRELPEMTQFFISLGQFLQRNIFLILAMIMAVYVTIKLIERLNPNIVILDRLKLKLPFIGKIMVENAITVFSRTLAILVSGGITVPESTEIAVGTFTNKYFIKQIKDVPEKIREGNSLSDSLEEVNFIPNVLVEVIRVGETSGNLVDVLNENADSFENSIDAKVNSLISMIEPILIVCMGVVIGFMLISVYLPIFSTVDVVR